jgi:hypothetical protein
MNPVVKTLFIEVCSAAISLNFFFSPAVRAFGEKKIHELEICFYSVRLPWAHPLCEIAVPTAF